MLLVSSYVATTQKAETVYLLTYLLKTSTHMWLYIVFGKLPPWLYTLPNLWLRQL